ncbi:MAG: hypothetical protein LIP02_09320, partial [Bacteroidales bacterium]|nr:hypothetical protein [Bacteroidales bacterium]
MYPEEEAVADEGGEAVTFTDGTDEQGGEIVDCTVELFSFVRLDELAYDTAEFTLQTKVIKRETGEDGNVAFAEIDREDDIRKLKENGYRCVRIYYKSEHHISDWEGYVGPAFYVREVAKLSDREYRVSCVSELGTVANGAHRGGLYNSDDGGTSGSTLIKEILPDADVTSTAPEVDGWLPYDTNRNNLKRILQALLLRSAYDEKTGAPKFEWYSNSTKSIARTKTFTGWNVEEPTTTKQVTGKVFELGTANCASSVYSGSLSSDNYETIVFSRPVLPSSVSNSSATNATINNTANVNWCEAKANTSGANVSINGNYYNTGTRLVTAETPESETTTGETEEVELEENGLLRHAQAAAEYVSFYSEVANSGVATLDYIYEGEKPGDCVSLAMTERGTIDKITVSLTSIARASMSVIDGYIPFSGEYDNMAIVTTSNNNYQISNANQNRVKALAFHGGGGGGGGDFSFFENALTPTCTGAYDGQGGVAGSGGSSGGYTEYLYTLNSSAATLNIALGNGGNGGNAGSHGNNGESTIVEMPSSFWLTVTEANVNNSAARSMFFSNGRTHYMSYPGTGPDLAFGGLAGVGVVGNGQTRYFSCSSTSLRCTEINARTRWDALRIAYVGGNGLIYAKGGNGATSLRLLSGTSEGIYCYGGGGGGGGLGGAGASGQDAPNALSASKNCYSTGSGGSGGNGGGGGGGGGFFYSSNQANSKSPRTYYLTPGLGGNGGNGIGGGGNGGGGGNEMSPSVGGIGGRGNSEGSGASNAVAYGGGGGAGGSVFNASIRRNANSNLYWNPLLSTG